MLKHWVVVHVDLVNFQAAYLDPKISPISSHPARLRELLVRWLEVQLDHGKIDQKLKLIEKKCEQHDDSSVVAILNIVALARGYSLAADIDTAHHRTRLIDRLETVTVSSKPGRRLKQWTNHNGLRTADTMFTGRSPASGLSTTGSTSSPDKDESSESKSLWDWLMGPDAVSIPQAPTSNKRKTEASSATAGAPAKRRRAEDSTEEQSSYWPCPAWWGKDDGLDDVHKATEQLRKELDMARADIWAIVSKLNKIEQRNGPL
ncbi:hypothetical protein N0V84_000782 [Fusarium piperis]|uniref:Uncharacterized protein n=1 Tax=Fusarium piperis TaxID=1435070 RepID=A0A9W9BUH5_9HYPO|nr:hypothetical protein N0V84_000782 [Fusarium piperis]